MNLVYRDPAGETRSFALAGRAKVTLGREEGRELVLAEALVSRHHATIESVEGAFFLRDAGSANGTYLNGLRLTGASAIMLREGDVIEIGSTCLVFCRDAHGRVPLETASADGLETSFDLGDLVLDGLVAFKGRGEVEQMAWEETLARLAKDQRPLALERVLGLVVQQARVDGAAIFLAREPGGELALEACCPGESPGKRLAAIAARARVAGGGRIFCPRIDALAPVDGSATLTTPRSHTTAAVAFLAAGDERAPGVLAVERFVPRLDRSDLALLAVMADRIARALSPAPEIS